MMRTAFDERDHGSAASGGTASVTPGPRGGDEASWAALAAAEPGAETVSALDAAEPKGMSGAQLVDAIVACEKTISHLHAVQAGLTAAFARPGVPGDVTALVNKLTAKRGAARGTDGQIDPDLLAAHIEDFTRSLAAAEIAAALHIPHRTAGSRIDNACELTQQLPTTFRALHVGRIDQRRASVIADATRCLNPDARAAAEEAVAPLAEDRLPAQLAELLDRAVIAADPDAAVTREKQARADRNVRHYPDRDGMGKIHANMPAEAAAAAYTLLDLLAQATDPHLTSGDRQSTDRRGIDARRADAMADIFTELLATGRIDLTRYGTRAGDTETDDSTDSDTGDDGDGVDDSSTNADDPTIDSGTDTEDGTSTEAGTGDDSDDESRCPTCNRSDHHGAPRDGTEGDAVDDGDDEPEARWRGLSRHGRRPHLTVTIGMSTLAGLDRLPGHLAGHGAITAELATAIADAYQTLTLVGVQADTGTAAAVSHTVYRPRQHLTDQIAALAGTCRFPSCRQPGWRCDTDHRVPFNHADPAAGGLTSLWDCDPECRRHHLLKTHARWLVEGRPDRCIQFTSPTGHHYLTRPHEYTLPGETTDPDLAHLVLPATWPIAKPTPPPDEQYLLDSTDPGDDERCGARDRHDSGPDGDDGDRPLIERISPQMRQYLADLHAYEQQQARYRAIGHRLRHLMRGEPITGPGRRPDTGATGTSGPTTNTGRGAPGRPGATGPSGATGPPGAFGPPQRRRRPNDRARTDQAAVERAIRVANGEPDPADEPPPF